MANVFSPLNPDSVGGTCLIDGSKYLALFWWIFVDNLLPRLKEFGEFAGGYPGGIGMNGGALLWCGGSANIPIEVDMLFVCEACKAGGA
jgi:hypothetical protein